MKAYGAYTALISGGFTFFADHFGKRIGFDESTAQPSLNFDGDVLDGTVTEPIVGKDAKLNRLDQLAERGSASPRSRRWRSATAPTIST